MHEAGARLLPLVLLLQGSGAEGVKNTIDCIANTGTECKKDSCEAWHGSGVTCAGGKCVCGAGTCSGENGVCTSAPYMSAGSGTKFRFRSVGYPDRYLHAEEPDDQLKGITLEEAEEEGQSADTLKWTVSLPGYSPDGPEIWRNDGAQAFLLASAAYPDSTVQLETWLPGENGFPKLKRVQKQGSDDVGPGVVDNGVYIFVAPGERAAFALSENATDADRDVPVMIMSAARAYGKEQVLMVNGRTDKLEFSRERGEDNVPVAYFWYVEPPLPKEVWDHLTLYKRQRCKTCETRTVSTARGLGCDLAVTALLALALAALL